VVYQKGFKTYFEFELMKKYPEMVVEIGFAYR
jgi:hypothetical protein